MMPGSKKISEGIASIKVIIVPPQLYTNPLNKNKTKTEQLIDRLDKKSVWKPKTLPKNSNNSILITEFNILPGIPIF